MAQANFQDALQCYTRAVEHDSSDVTAWNGYVECLTSLKRLDEARIVCRRAAGALPAPNRELLLRQFYLTIPHELADAARVDGATPWQIYRHIYVPLAKPALATLAIFTFMWNWNDLLDPLIYLRDLPTYTVTVGLAFFKGQFIGKWPEMMAGALVSLAPMIILFVVAQRQFVRGITLTGIKG